VTERTEPSPADDSEQEVHTPEIQASPQNSTTRNAQLIAIAILFSRMAGLVRESVFAHFVGNTMQASAFRAALRMPNVLQNLLGEGTLSASFIPVYASLLEKGEDEKAGRLAGAIFSLLLVVAAALALIGVLAAPVLVSIFFTGMEKDQKELTIVCTRIIFPMTSMLVLSAWSLGILNSHRKFFISYVAPVLWNAAMITTLFVFGSSIIAGGAGDEESMAAALSHLIVVLCWGALVGGALQFLVQVPFVLRSQRALKINWNLGNGGVRTVMRNAGPAVLGRGVVQLSGWVDMWLAAWIFAGAIAALGYAQTLYFLPYSLFGMSVAAAELPEMSRNAGGSKEVLVARVNSGLRRIALFIIPSTIGLLTLGDVIIAGMFESGQFKHSDTMFVYCVLAGYAIGLIASTSTRMYVSAFYAEHDTKTPAQIALVRVGLSAALGAALMVYLELNVEVLGNPLGAAGLSAAGGIVAWVEWFFLRRYLRGKIGPVGAGNGVVAHMLIAALAGAIVGRGLVYLLPDFGGRLGNIILAAVSVGSFAVVYFGVATALGVDDARAVVSRITRRFR
jgi:putative peptidoglycan lipid II flippase